MSSRQERRAGMTTEARVTLLEGDLDDQAVDLDRLANALEGIRRVMVGILVSVTTASLLLVANLALPS
jgi:cell division protein FtsX